MKLGAGRQLFYLINAYIFCGAIKQRNFCKTWRNENTHSN